MVTGMVRAMSNATTMVRASYRARAKAKAQAARATATTTAMAKSRVRGRAKVGVGPWPSWRGKDGSYSSELQMSACSYGRDVRVTPTGGTIAALESGLVLRRFWLVRDLD